MTDTEPEIKHHSWFTENILYINICALTRSTWIKGNLFISLPKISFCIIIISREEEIAMETNLAKTIAYDLTMEYLRQKRYIDRTSQNEETTVNMFIKKYQTYYSLLKDKEL